MKIIGERAFDECNSLETITIPEGVETIKDNAFSYCHKLERVIIPASVKIIGTDIILSGEYTKYISEPIYKASICAPENSYAHKYAVDNNLIYFPCSEMNPVTPEEFYAYLSENGNVSFHGRYIVYCDEIDFCPGDVIFTYRSGGASINGANEYFISSGTDSSDVNNTLSKIVKIYVAISQGDQDWILTHSKGWNKDILKSRWNFHVDEDLNIEVKTLKGDLNKDHFINIVDYILLKNLILTDTELSDIESSDLSGDGAVNSILKDNYNSHTQQ